MFKVARRVRADLALFAHQVRYDRAVGAATAIKFMTDGILMREVQEDFLLRRYSVVVIDEAHERSLNTDLLLGEDMHHTPSSCLNLLSGNEADDSSTSPVAGFNQAAAAGSQGQ